MYLRRIHIENIRSIQHLEINFPENQLPGWHVILGDNGAGKSTLVRAISLGLFGPNEAVSLRQNWGDWLSRGKVDGSIRLEIEVEPVFDRHDSRYKNYSPLEDNLLSLGIKFFHKKNGSPETSGVGIKSMKLEGMARHVGERIWGEASGYFSAAYGPYRRFSGGNADLMRIFESNPKVGRHLTAFGEDVALPEVIAWLKHLHLLRLEKKGGGKTLDLVEAFFKGNDLLPHNAQFDEISSQGVYFKDGNGAKINVNELSDGYRSILSMIFELIRQLVLTYGTSKVFSSVKNKVPCIDVPGVVLIDEVDAHLHPTWQTRIGEWFTKYFPKIQFIVTTHSPLVCRAAEKGSIWRVAAPGSDQGSGEILGQDKDRLIFGNVLDAYGTEAFGSETARGEKSQELLLELAQLNKKSSFGEMTSSEKKKRDKLRKTLMTDDQVEL